MEETAVIPAPRPVDEEELLDLADNFVACAIANYARGWDIACWLVENDPQYAQYVPPGAPD